MTIALTFFILTFCRLSSLPVGCQPAGEGPGCRDSGTALFSIVQEGATRLRPILMTAIATIGALIPLAIGSGGGGLISKGLGITVIGGLTSSTLLTLIVVPIVYEILSKLFKKNMPRTSLHLFL